MFPETISISEASHRLLRELVEHTGQSATEILDDALHAYRRRVFFEQMDAGYAVLRNDPQSWGEHETERKTWDATLMDGLDENERWSDDGNCLTHEPGQG